MVTGGATSHLLAPLFCGEKKMILFSPVGAWIAGSVGSMGGVVCHGLNTMGGTGRGSVGVLAGHASMLCAVAPGVLRCRKNGDTLRIRVGKGVANVEGTETTVLVSTAQVAEE